jgi:hypothetical protein
MTTIVYCPKSGLLVADRKISDESLSNQMDKIRKVKGGGWFAGSGNCHDIEKAYAWVNAGRPDPAPTFESLAAVVVYSDGKVFLLEEPCTWLRVRKQVVAVGSGAQYALGAYQVTKDVVASVKIGIRLDDKSGGKPQIVRVLKQEAT